MIYQMVLDHSLSKKRNVFTIKEEVLIDKSEKKIKCRIFNK